MALKPHIPGEKMIPMNILGDDDWRRISEMTRHEIAKRYGGSIIRAERWRIIARRRFGLPIEEKRKPDSRKRGSTKGFRVLRRYKP